MKRIYALIACVLMGLLLLLTIIGFSKDKKSDEEVIASFLETYFTNPSDDVAIYKKYMTDNAYKSWIIDRGYIRCPSNNNVKERISNLELSDIKIEPIPDKNETYHYYSVSFKLKNNSNNKEKEVTDYKISLEKEGSKWKIGRNNTLSMLQYWIYSMYDYFGKN